MLTALCIAWFLLPAHAIGVNGKIQRPSILPLPPMSDHTWDISLREVAVKDRYVDDLRTLLDQREGSDFRPDTTILATREYGSPNWRRLHYYFPEYHSYWLIDSALAGSSDFGAETYVAHNNQVTSATGASFWLPVERPSFFGYVWNRAWTISSGSSIRHRPWPRTCLEIRVLPNRLSKDQARPFCIQNWRR